MQYDSPKYITSKNYVSFYTILENKKYVKESINVSRYAVVF